MEINLHDIKKITAEEPTLLTRSFARTFKFETKDGEVLSITVFDEKVANILIKKSK